MELVNQLFPYRCTILYVNWHPGVHHWLRQSVGDGNFKYIKPQDAGKYFLYGFRYEDDSLAFKLIFR
jgi:hypothetical protein